MCKGLLADFFTVFRFPAMAGNAKTEKVELYAPALEELRNGKAIRFESHARTLNFNFYKERVK